MDQQLQQLKRPREEDSQEPSRSEPKLPRTEVREINPGTARVQVKWIVDGKRIWWSSEISRTRDKDAKGRTVWEFMYDPMPDLGFDEEEIRYVVFTAPHILVDQEEGDLMLWRRDGESVEPLDIIGIGCRVKTTHAGPRPHVQGESFFALVSDIAEDGTYQLLYDVDHKIEDKVDRNLIEVVADPEPGSSFGDFNPDDDDDDDEDNGNDNDNDNDNDVRDLLQQAHSHSDQVIEADIETVMHVLVHSITSDPRFKSLDITAQQTAASQIAQMRVSIEAKLEALRTERGLDYAISGQDIRDILADIRPN
jgi:hypothetical protein